MTDDRRRSFPQFSAGAFKFLGDEFFVWKDSLILGGEHLVGEIVECVVGLCCSLFGAKNESDAPPRSSAPLPEGPPLV